MDNIKAIERSIITNFRKPLWRRFIKGIQDYELIEPGDKIAVCITGGRIQCFLRSYYRNYRDMVSFILI